MIDILPILVTVVLAGAAAASPPPHLQSLLAAERDLAARMRADGARAALRERFAPIAVLLVPRPAGAFEWLAEHPLPEGIWTQRTEYAEISGAGDLGVTVGTWRLAPAGGGSESFGRYAAVWRWHERTSWRLACGGALEGAPAAGGAPAGDSLGAPSLDPVFRVGDRTVIFPHDSLAVERAALQAADRALGSSPGASTAASHARRDCADPLLVAVDSPARDPAHVVFEPVGARTAESADLGYTFGTCRRPAAGASPGSMRTWGYLHVWRRGAEGRRCLALEFAVPAPPRP